MTTAVPVTTDRATTAPISSWRRADQLSWWRPAISDTTTTEATSAATIRPALAMIEISAHQSPTWITPSPRRLLK